MNRQIARSRGPGPEHLVTGGDAGYAMGAAAEAGGAAAASDPPARAARARHIAEIAILVVMLTWGANVVAVKAILSDVPPILFASVRFGTAFLVLLAVLRWREGSVGLPRGDIVPMLLLVLAGFGLYRDLWATALGRTTVSNSALITAATPVSTMLIAAAVGSDTISRPKVIGAVTALSGRWRWSLPRTVSASPVPRPET